MARVRWLPRKGWFLCQTAQERRSLRARAASAKCSERPRICAQVKGASLSRHGAVEELLLSLFFHVPSSFVGVARRLQCTS